MRISDWSSDVCSSDLYQMVRACRPLMKAQGFGAVVNVSSIGGLLGVGSCMAYSASKGALNTMTMAMARTLGPEIRVNAVCPGFIASRSFSDPFGPAGLQQKISAQQCITHLGRAGTPPTSAQAARSPAGG